MKKSLLTLLWRWNTLAPRWLAVKVFHTKKFSANLG
jgi:hypothetical protein